MGIKLGTRGGTARRDQDRPIPHYQILTTGPYLEAK